MRHVFILNSDVVLRNHVVCQVVIDNEPQKSIHQGVVHLFVDFLKLGLHQDNTLIVLHVPNISQVIDALTPFVSKEGWRL